MRTPVEDVYLLALHEPYESSEQPASINATIVHARTLLHAAVPQPDGGRMYRCLTEAPMRQPGELVPVSTLTYELEGGALWPQVADWEKVVAAVTYLGRHRHCDAIPLPLDPIASTLLANGPMTAVRAFEPNGTEHVLGWQERQETIDALVSHIRRFSAEAPFWPGEPLVAVPQTPTTMPFETKRSRPRDT